MLDEEKKTCSEWQKEVYVGSQVFQKQEIRRIVWKK